MSLSSEGASSVLPRCECRGSTGLKISYYDPEIVEHVQERLSRELGKPLYVYDCPQGKGQHISRVSPEEMAARLVAKQEHEQRVDAFGRKFAPSSPIAALSQLMWRADHLAGLLRGEAIRSRDDLVNLVYHPSQGWQASAPIKATCTRGRWVRVRATTAEDAVAELIRVLESKVSS